MINVQVCWQPVVAGQAEKFYKSVAAYGVWGSHVLPCILTALA